VSNSVYKVLAKRISRSSNSEHISLAEMACLYLDIEYTSDDVTKNPTKLDFFKSAFEETLQTFLLYIYFFY